MAKHSKQRIEKDNFHSYIFDICRERIFQANRNSPRVLDIEDALDMTSRILSKEEFLIIESYNSDNKTVINEALNRTIDDLDTLSETSDSDKITRFLKKTYKFIRTHQRNIYKKQMSIKRAIVDNNNSETNLLPTVELTVQKAFYTYYRIVSLIVEDINAMPGWKDISDYYKTKYEISDPVHTAKGKRLTFLSYAFKDNIYALFLFDLFEKNGGFLYVDSLFGTDYGNDGSRIKSALSPWIDHACQILFLHSIHSDKVKKGLSSWCSWELGEAYKSSNEEPKGFFKVVVAGIRREDTHPIVDHHFKELDYVRDGIIYQKK